MCFVMYFKIGVLRTFWWMKIENTDIAIHTEMNLFEEDTSVTEKMVLKKKLFVFLMLERQKRWRLHMTDLFTCRKYMLNCL